MPSELQWQQFMGPDDDKIMWMIKEMQHAGLDIEDQGHPAAADYVGITISRRGNGYIELT